MTDAGQLAEAIAIAITFGAIGGAIGGGLMRLVEKLAARHQIRRLSAAETAWTKVQMPYPAEASNAQPRPRSERSPGAGIDPP